MKNVLLLVHDDEGQEARLQVALDVTRALSGHLTCLDVVNSARAIAEFELGCVEGVMLAEVRERESRHLADLKARLAHEDVAWSATEVTGDPADKLREAASLADLIVVSSRAGKHDSADARRIAAELAVKSGRPVLAVPPSTKRLDVTGQVLIAWNGSDEAEAALRAAVPLLQHARLVTVLAVDLPDGASAAEEAASYLSRHGVRAEIVARSSEWTISDVILAEALSVGAHYIVMGAYGLGRAVDTIFGGVSGEILTRSEFPLFLAH